MIYLFLSIALILAVALWAFLGDLIPLAEQARRDLELARLDEIDRERGSLGAFDRFEADLEDGSPFPL